MHMLVTGGAGFIGRHVVRALVRAGHTITIFDNFSTSQPPLDLDHVCTVIDGDICNFRHLRDVMEGFEVVLHFAGLVSVPRSIAEPMLNHDINVTGTFNVFEAARQAGVRRVVYASSASVYGVDPELPKHENSRIAPVSPYGTAKYMAEMYASAFCRSYPDIEFVGLRYMNVYGPGQDPFSPYSGVLSLFCRAGLMGQPCLVFGDGSQTRDFVFVSDVAHANVLATTAPLPERDSVFNVGSGEQTSLNQIIMLLNMMLPAPLDLEYRDARAGDIQHSYADISKIKAALHFAPRVSVPAGLQTTLNWLKEEHQHGVPGIALAH